MLKKTYEIIKKGHDKPMYEYENNEFENFDQLCRDYETGCYTDRYSDGCLTIAEILKLL